MVAVSSQGGGDTAKLIATLYCTLTAVVINGHLLAGESMTLESMEYSKYTEHRVR